VSIDSAVCRSRRICHRRMHLAIRAYGVILGSTMANEVRMAHRSPDRRTGADRRRLRAGLAPNLLDQIAEKFQLVQAERRQHHRRRPQPTLRTIHLLVMSSRTAVRSRKSRSNAEGILPDRLRGAVLLDWLLSAVTIVIAGSLAVWITLAVTGRIFVLALFVWQLARGTGR
jgi:hypothetical protein